MRMGFSWPIGRGRRMWISGSLVEWLTWIPLFAIAWAVCWIIANLAAATPLYRHGAPGIPPSRLPARRNQETGLLGLARGDTATADGEVHGDGARQQALVPGRAGR
jgi:hypothetical protein